jgi:hypothetical protein
MDVPLQQLDLKPILMKGSISDILHDFGTIVSKTELKTNVNFSAEVKNGLPDTDGIPMDKLNEDDFVNSIIDKINDIKKEADYDFNFVPNTEFINEVISEDKEFQGFEFRNKIQDKYFINLQKIVDKKFGQINEKYGNGNVEPTKKFNITTITGFNYTITQAVIKNKKNGLVKKIKGEKYTYNEPLPILKVLGIETNSAFVVDFAAISLPDFLTTESEQKIENEMKLYFISNPETENDPAGKTGVTTPAYKNISNKNFKNGVEIFSLQQMSSIDNVTNYKWNDDINLSTNRFFTKYNFALTDLKEIKDGKNIKFQTDLTISYTDVDNTPYEEVIIDSGNFGQISNVISSIFSKIKELFSQKNKQDIFFMNSKLQHKRSGDWLQVLSCLNLKENNFKYPKFKYPRNKDKNAYNNKEFSNTDNEQISDIYFVTHDRIPFAFALLLGVNVVYTHNDTGAYYVFKSTKELSPEEKQKKYTEETSKILESDKYKTIITDDNNASLISKITKFNTLRETLKENYESTIKGDLEKINNIKTIKLPIIQAKKEESIIIPIRELFKKLYIYSKFLVENERINIDNINTLYSSIKDYKIENGNIEQFVKNYKQYISYSERDIKTDSIITTIDDSFKKFINNWNMNIVLGRKIVDVKNIEQLVENSLSSLLVWDKIFNYLPSSMKIDVITTFNNIFKPYYKNYMIVSTSDIPETIKFVRDTPNLNEYKKFSIIITKFIADIDIKFKTNVLSQQEPEKIVEQAPVELSVQNESIVISSYMNLSTIKYFNVGGEKRKDFEDDDNEKIYTEYTRVPKRLKLDDISILKNRPQVSQSKISQSKTRKIIPKTRKFIPRPIMVSTIPINIKKNMDDEVINIEDEVINIEDVLKCQEL